MRLHTFLTAAALGCLPAAALPQRPVADSALPQFALGKVLADSHEIWGDAPTTKGQRPSRATWMSTYPDSAPLSSLSIPGTHDAATWNYSVATQDALRHLTQVYGGDAATLRDPLVYRCQRASIAAALEAGVRFFDLRYAFDPTDTFLVFWHNEALLSERAAVETVLFAFWAWLDAHPSETVLLSLMYQGSTKAGASNSAAVQTQLLAMLTSPAARRYFVQERAALGTLGAARGKAVLLRRFDLDQLAAGADEALPGLHLSPADWPDNGRDFGLVYDQATNATAYVEDYYEPDDIPLSANATVNIAAKLNATVAHLERAADQEPESLFITFASGGHLASTPPVYPQTMAVGNGTEVTPFGGVNQQLVPVLKGLKGKRLGVVVLDFFDEPEDLVDLVLGL